MATYEVDAFLVIETMVRVTVEADDKESALDAAAALLPSNSDRGASAKWRAKIDIKPPPGVSIGKVEARHFSQASGGEKVRKVGP